MFYNYIERSNAMLELLLLYLNSNDDVKASVVEILKQGQQPTVLQESHYEIDQ